MKRYPAVRLLLWRWLPLRRRWGPIQFIALLSAIGIALGTATLVSVLSIFKGFHHAVQGLLLRYEPHVRLVPQTGPWFRLSPDTLQLYARLLDARVAMPTITLRLVARCGEALSPAILIAAPEEALRRATALAEATVVGEFLFRLNGVPAAVLGAGLAERLRAMPGDTLRLWTPAMLEQLALGFSFHSGVSLIVAGIAQTPTGDHYGLVVYADTAVGRLLAGFPAQSWSTLDLWLPTAEELPRALHLLQQRGNGTFRTVPWYELHRQLYDVLRLERLGTFSVLSLIVLVAVFNVAAALRMSVVRKRRELALVRALGMSAGDIQRLYLFQGCVLGGAGLMAGILAGMAFYWGQQQFGWIRLDPTRYILPTLPVFLEPWDVLLIAGISFGLVLLAALVPARWAARQPIAEALREE